MERGPSWEDFFAVAIGGGLGSLLRFSVSLLATKTWGAQSGHWGTLCVNLVGCLLIGCFGGAIAMGLKPSDRWISFIRAGMLGGLTTFSAFGWEVFLLSSQQRYAAGAIHLAANVLFGLVLVAVGYWLGRWYMMAT